MLVELSVRHLGVIAEASLVLGSGMTALTGETGAGKTLLVEALELLLGGRPDPVLVRPGAAEAVVEGRFELSGSEVVLARSVPAQGRSRAWVDARMAPAAALAELGARLVDLHGQHAHQALLGPAAQRAALDAWGRVDHGPRERARAELRRIEGQLAELGGDARSRTREIDLLRFQLDELARAGLEDPEEDEALAAEESRLAGAGAHREAALSALAALTGEGPGGAGPEGVGPGGAGPGAAGALGAAVGILGGHAPLAPLEQRLRGLGAELADTASDLRHLAEALEDDPRRLEEVRGRRQALRDLQRKYGDSLAEVMAYGGEAARRLADLEGHAARVAELEEARARAGAGLDREERAMAAARRAAAPRLATEVRDGLRTLAMPRARFEVRVGEDQAGDDVSFGLGANPGEPVLALAKVASGGELARAMLALRLALLAAPETGRQPDPDGPGERPRRSPPAAERPVVPDAPTLVFDEVDAGIGGEAALAVGRALAALGRRHQVLVVTHLAQVAAFADHQVAVAKVEHAGRTVARLSVLDEAARVVELSRMLSGQPASATARDHAGELLDLAARQRGR